MATSLDGKNRIGHTSTSEGSSTFTAHDPSTSEALEPTYHEATEAEVDRSLALAQEAFHPFREVAPEVRATFLRAIADELEQLGDVVLERADLETGLGSARLKGERTRTTNQLRMFAHLISDGSWVDARIDSAVPDRQPQPKPDLRRMLVPVGPVAVFGASNFPFAFSVAGGDTASALASGCPVVVKAHPAHPGTSEMVADAVLRAADTTGMPNGVFSLLQGAGHEVGLELVKHPLTRAVAFTGSQAGGRALFDAAAARPEPIPVYAEMGSTNPVFILPQALQQRGAAIAKALTQSMTLGVGQFCTKPGLVMVLDGAEARSWIETAGAHVENVAPGTMLYGGICQAYSRGIERLLSRADVDLVAQAEASADPSRTEAAAVLASTTARTLLENPDIAEENFGPSALVVRCESREELLRVAHGLEGHLTATIHGTEDELEGYLDLVGTVQDKVGRLLFNGFPTGVEVCSSMHHGGPYPATTDAYHTSVGTAAIYRFVRPIAFQDFPQAALPAELQDGNPRAIRRLVDGAPEAS